MRKSGPGRFAVAVLLSLCGLGASSGALADCESSHSRVVREAREFRIQNIGQTGDMCAMASAAAEFYPKVMQFYERCPGQDPGGQARRDVDQIVDLAEKMQREKCA